MLKLQKYQTYKDDGLEYFFLILLIENKGSFKIIGAIKAICLS